MDPSQQALSTNVSIVRKLLDAAKPTGSGITIVAVILAVTLVAIALQRFSVVTRDSSEPPVVRPLIPFIGHLLGIIRHQSNYHKILKARYPSKPCMTLPILNGKMYTVYDPSLIQQVLRAKTASFEAFEAEFAQKVFNLSNEAFAKIVEDPLVISEFTDAIHRSFQTESLYKMNMCFLGHLAKKMDPISRGVPDIDPTNLGKERIKETGSVEIENFFLWCRDVMTLATTQALYGAQDPFAGRADLLDAIWIVEESLPYFLLFSSATSFFMPRAFQARAKLQAAMSAYYEAEHGINEPTTATIVVNRAGSLRKSEFKGQDVGKMEMILPTVATLNTVPTLYWLLLYILGNLELLNRLREEIEALAERNGKIATLDISKFESDLPLLVSCYRETLRLINHSVSNRRITADLTITTQEGTSFLLKKGVDVQLPAGVTHAETRIWGSDAPNFNPERFLLAKQSRDTERLRKQGFVPFGGGRHLCPGRNFAFTEIIGFAAMLLLGYDAETLGMEAKLMKMQSPQMASGTVKPVANGKGLGARIDPRQGWEGIEWRFVA